jgi:hypothetical protein
MRTAACPAIGGRREEEKKALISPLFKYSDF